MYLCACLTSKHNRVLHHVVNMSTAENSIILNINMHATPFTRQTFQEVHSTYTVDSNVVFNLRLLTYSLPLTIQYFHMSVHWPPLNPFPSHTVYLQIHEYFPFSYPWTLLSQQHLNSNYFPPLESGSAHSYLWTLAWCWYIHNMVHLCTPHMFCNFPPLG